MCVCVLCFIAIAVIKMHLEKNVLIWPLANDNDLNIYVIVIVFIKSNCGGSELP